MPVLIFSGLLAAPATVFADEVTSEDTASEDNMATSAAEPVGASWYGSLRGGIEFMSDKDASYFKAEGSRWGIKGSSEVSEGLSAVYRFEHAIETHNAGQPNGRLAFVGLSGGFGALTLGRIDSASYNHTGVIRDIGNWYTSGDTGNKIGNTLSYAFSADAFSVQVDAIMDGGKDTGKAIDQLEFGMTVNLGDIGKIALAHTKVEDAMKGTMTHTAKIDKLSTTYNPQDTVPDPDTRETITLKEITLTVAKNNADIWDSAKKESKVNTLTTAALRTELAKNKYVKRYDGGKVIGLAETCTAPTTAAPEPADECMTAKVLVFEANENKYFSTNNAAVTSKADMEYGSKANHISAQFDIGGLTVALGYSQTKFNDPMKTMKQKTTFVGASGSIGDTGLDWRAFHREIENTVKEDKQKSGKTKKWTVGLGKSLGGGASVYVEHGNNPAGDGKDGTVVGLRVDF